MIHKELRYFHNRNKEINITNTYDKLIMQHETIGTNAFTFTQEQQTAMIHLSDILSHSFCAKK